MKGQTRIVEGQGSAGVAPGVLPRRRAGSVTELVGGRKVQEKGRCRFGRSTSPNDAEYVAGHSFSHLPLRLPRALRLSLRVLPAPASSPRPQLSFEPPSATPASSGHSSSLLGELLLAPIDPCVNHLSFSSTVDMASASVFASRAAPRVVFRQARGSVRSAAPLRPAVISPSRYAQHRTSCY